MTGKQRIKKRPLSLTSVSRLTTYVLYLTPLTIFKLGKVVSRILFGTSAIHLALAIGLFAFIFITSLGGS